MTNVMIFFGKLSCFPLCDSGSLAVEEINSNLLDVVDRTQGQTYRPLLMKDRFLYLFTYFITGWEWVVLSPL